MTTTATGLRRIGRINRNYHTTGTFRLVREELQESRPCCVSDALGKAMVMHHAVDVYILNRNQAEAVDDAATVLVREVVALISDAFMDACHDLAALGPFRRTLRLFRHPTLCPGKRPFFFAEETRVINGFASRQSSKSMQANVNTDLGIGRFQFGNLALAGQGDVPLAAGGALNAASLRRALKRTMQDDRHDAHFRQIQLIAIQLAAVAVLRVAERIVAVAAPKPGIPWRLTDLDAPKECLESEVDTHGDILQDLRMRHGQGRTLFLDFRQLGMLVVQTDALLPFFPRHLALFEQVIVEPAAFIQRLTQDGLLALCGINPVLERPYRFVHDWKYSTKPHRSQVPMFGKGLKPLKRVKGLYPTAKAGGLYALFRNLFSTLL